MSYPQQRCIQLSSSVAFTNCITPRHSSHTLALNDAFIVGRFILITLPCMHGMHDTQNKHNIHKAGWKKKSSCRWVPNPLLFRGGLSCHSEAIIPPFVHLAGCRAAFTHSPQVGPHPLTRLQWGTSFLGGREPHPPEGG